MSQVCCFAGETALPDEIPGFSILLLKNWSSNLNCPSETSEDVVVVIRPTVEKQN